MLLAALGAATAGASAQDGTAAPDPELRGARWFYSLEAALAEPAAVQKLDLSGRGYVEVPPELFRLPHLRLLLLNHNRLARLPPEFATLRALAELELNHNAFETFPPEILALENLIELELSGNRLTAIPEEIERLQSLSELEVVGNRLIRLPASLARMPKLEELKLNDNRLAGLNAALGALPRLNEVSVAGNQLEALPATFLQSESLRVLDLSRNRLRAVPVGLERLNLQICRLWQDTLAPLTETQIQHFLGVPENDLEAFALHHAENGQRDLSLHYLGAIQRHLEGRPPLLRVRGYLAGAKAHRLLNDPGAAEAAARRALELLAEVAAAAALREDEPPPPNLAEWQAEARTLLALAENLSLRSRLGWAVGGALAAGLLLAVAVLGVVLWSRAKLARAHALLGEQKAVIEGQAEALARGQEVLARQAGELGRLNATKDKLFSIIGHDLRNPFGAIEGLAEEIRREGPRLPAARLDEYATLIQAASRESTALLGNLLEWARAQSGQLRYRPSFLDAGALLTEVAGLHGAAARVKHQTLRVQTAPGLRVHADRAMLLTILRNLVSNAVKFTPEGGEVTLTAGGDAESVELAVRDTGAGLEPEQAARLLELAGQISTPGTAGERGGGLGLVLCREFAERNGGTLAVESAPGAGSTFRLRLPRCGLPVAG